jgi:FkbM family methyltransferase
MVGLSAAGERDMRVLDRDVRAIAAAPFRRRHWTALLRMFAVYDRPTQALLRYLSNSGSYPWSPTLRTPVGPVQPTLANRHDLLTVNEIFCRHDYGDGAQARVVVDIGANVGLAALFFLTRRPDSRVYCFEPDPANAAHARASLVAYGDRVVIIEKAVTPTSQPSLRFVPAGRYGHAAGADEDGVELPAVGLEDALRNVLDREPTIDLVKIDTEGSEFDLVAALTSSDVSDRVGAVVFEDNHGHTRWV